jgi:hypothetical protein
MIINNIIDREFFDTRHGGAFDRGSADSWYSRNVEPHYYIGDTGSSEKITELTAKEVLEYMAGYQYNEKFGGKKSWD